MIEYGLLASKSSEMFSDTTEMFFNILYSLKGLIYSNPYIMIAIVVFAIVFYYAIWKQWETNGKLTPGGENKTNGSSEIDLNKVATTVENLSMQLK